MAEKMLDPKDTVTTMKFLQSVSRLSVPAAVSMVKSVIFSSRFDQGFRERTAMLLGRSGGGEGEVLRMLDSKTISSDIKPFLAKGIAKSWKGNVRRKAAEFLTGVTPVSGQVPKMSELLSFKSDAAHGKTLFSNNCAVCHQVGKEGNDFGPKLSEIGNKLPKEALLEAIVHPSAGISFGYEGWELKLKDGSVIAGIISSRTNAETEIKFPGGSNRKIKNEEVVSRKEMKESMMTAGLAEHMKAQDLADLLGFLEGLKNRN